jgi:hypothetical protein
MKKDHFIYEQATAFHPDDFLQVPHQCALVVCSHCCHMVQKLSKSMPFMSQDTINNMSVH